jgi:serine/threonine protein kinase
MSERSATGDWSAPAAAGSGWPAVPGYEVLEELGRGGMGVVYRARQVSLKRLVALKVIRDGALAGAHERARFRIEAEAAARMQHPHIVQIYEAGEHEGRPYFVMELVEGGSLERHLAGRPQPALVAAQLVQRLALAVEHAHAQQVVHRDLKPANVLMHRDADREARDAGREARGEGHGARDEGEEVVSSPVASDLSRLIPKITDFGLAKRLDNESTACTVDGAILGTASYMAPEQAAGQSGGIGPATDVYALGAILYEMLTGRPPFQGATWQETVAQVLRGEAAPPTRLNPDVPRDLETVCLKCLEKEPSARYASAAALAADLQRFLEQLPVAAAPLSPRQRLARIAARDGYQLGEEIGRGPRSTVYRALHGPLQQPVAVKVFAEGICTRAAWDARLRRSADIWSGLAHPHLLAVRQAGWWDEAPYIALEYIAQGSLAAKLSLPAHSSAHKGGAEGVRQALRLVEQLAEVVNYLHRQGVVHGNLKPANVLLAADGIPRLGDLHFTGGLFLGDPGFGGRAEEGQYESMLASLGYVAPERVANAAAEPAPNADIYGLGAILYEMLAGRPPFAGDTPEETLAQVRDQAPAPPSQRNAAVTPATDALVLRCLRKNPWQRYYRVYDVLVRLRKLQEDPHAVEKPRRRPLS